MQSTSIAYLVNWAISVTSRSRRSTFNN